MAVSIRDIAKELRLSPGTVSACLSGNSASRRISAATAAAVLARAGELGYIPNRLAGRIFRRGKRKTIGLVLKYDEACGRNLPVLAEVMRELDVRGDCDYAVLYAAGDDLRSAIIQGIGLGVTDYVVLGYIHTEYLRSLDRLPTENIHFADFYAGEPDRTGIRTGARLGFDRRAFNDRLFSLIESCGRLPAVSDRRASGNDRRMQVIDYEFHPGMDLFQTGFELFATEAAKLFRLGRCRTLLLHNDRIAAGAMLGLAAAGLRIPDDIAVIGFNDEDFARWQPIPLTTVRPPVADNVKLLLDMILDGKSLPGAPPEPVIIWRESFPAPHVIDTTLN